MNYHQIQRLGGLNVAASDRDGFCRQSSAACGAASLTTPPQFRSNLAHQEIAKTSRTPYKGYIGEYCNHPTLRYIDV